MSVMKKIAAGILALGLSTVSLVAAANGDTPATNASLSAAGSWLTAQIGADGALADSRGDDSPIATVEAVQSMLVVGVDATTVKRTTSYLEENGDDLLETWFEAKFANAGKLAYAMAVLHDQGFTSNTPYTVGKDDASGEPGVDVISWIEDKYDQNVTKGIPDAWMILGLEKNGVEVPPGLVDQLIRDTFNPETGQFGTTTSAGTVPNWELSGLTLQTLQALPQDLQVPSVGLSVGQIRAKAASHLTNGLWANDPRVNGHAGYIIPALAREGVDVSAYVDTLAANILADGSFPAWTNENRGDQTTTVKAILGLANYHLTTPLNVPIPRPSEPPAPDPGPLDPACITVDSSSAAQRAGAWLAGLIGQRGAIEEGGRLDVNATVDSTFPLVAVGADTQLVARIAGYLNDPAVVSAYVSNNGRMGKMALAATMLHESGATAADATNWGGVNLISMLQDEFRVPSRANVYNEAWAIIGLSRAGQDVPPWLVERLVSTMHSARGSYVWGADASAIGLQALQSLDASRDSSVKELRDEVVTHLRVMGWKVSSASHSNTTTAGYMLPALAREGVDINADLTWLQGVQAADGRIPAYEDGAPGSDLMATNQAAMALANHHLVLGSLGSDPAKTGRCGADPTVEPLPEEPSPTTPPSPEEPNPTTSPSPTPDPADSPALAPSSSPSSVPTTSPKSGLNTLPATGAGGWVLGIQAGLAVIAALALARKKDLA